MGFGQPKSKQEKKNKIWAAKRPEPELMDTAIIETGKIGIIPNKRVQNIIGNNRQRTNIKFILFSIFLLCVPL